MMKDPSTLLLSSTTPLGLSSAALVGASCDDLVNQTLCPPLPVSCSPDARVVLEVPPEGNALYSPPGIRPYISCDLGHPLDGSRLAHRRPDVVIVSQGFDTICFKCAGVVVVDGVPRSNQLGVVTGPAGPAGERRKFSKRGLDSTWEFFFRWVG